MRLHFPKTPPPNGTDMVKTASTMLALDTPLPEFSLEDVMSGSTVSSGDFAGKPLLVMFVCAHCPFVKHLEAGIGELAKDYATKDVALVAVMSNDVAAYPDDAPDKLKAQAEANGWTFPYLHDADQSVAKAFTAACTPDFFIFDSFGKLAYRGQFDNSRPGDGSPVTGDDVRRALTSVVSGAPVQTDQQPSIGCNIKWKDAPDYFTGQPAA